MSAIGAVAITMLWHAWGRWEQAETIAGKRTQVPATFPQPKVV